METVIEKIVFEVGPQRIRNLATKCKDLGREFTTKDSEAFLFLYHEKITEKLQDALTEFVNGKLGA